jgi:hypothetical protein
MIMRLAITLGLALLAGRAFAAEADLYCQTGTSPSGAPIWKPASAANPCNVTGGGGGGGGTVTQGPRNTVDLTTAWYFQQVVNGAVVATANPEPIVITGTLPGFASAPAVTISGSLPSFGSTQTVNVTASTMSYATSGTASVGTSSGTLVTSGTYSTNLLICTLPGSTTHVWLNLTGGTAVVNSGAEVPENGGCFPFTTGGMHIPSSNITAITDSGSAQTVTVNGG